MDAAFPMPYRLLFAAALAAAPLCTPALAAPHDPITWKFGHPAPPASLLPPIWQVGFDWLHEASQGAITIKQYGGGTLYGVAGGLNALRAGVADFGTCYSTEEARGFELVKTLQLPFVVGPNPWLRGYIVHELATRHLKGEYQARGVYLAHMLPTAPMKILSKTPIRTPDDLRGKKIFSIMNAPGAAKALGYTEVRVPFPELYSSLQLGVIDAVIWLDMGILPFKLFEQARFYTDINIGMATVETCYNQRSYDNLPASLKPLMQEAQQKILVEMVRKSIAVGELAKTTLTANGVEILSLSENDTSTWKAAFAPTRETWFEQCKQTGKDCRSLADEIHALEAKHEGLDEAGLIKLLQPATEASR